MPQGIKPQPKRRGQLVEQVTAQVRDRAVQALRTAVLQRQQVDRIVRRSIINDALAVHAVLGRELEEMAVDVQEVVERREQEIHLRPVQALRVGRLGHDFVAVHDDALAEIGIPHAVHEVEHDADEHIRNEEIPRSGVAHQ